LEAGAPGYSFNRMDVNILRAVTEEAHAKKLPVAVHTGNAKDVDDAVSLPADSIEHGSFADEISDATIAEMKAKGIAYDPTLSVVEGFTSFSRGDTSLLKRSLVQQVTKKELLDGTQQAASKPELDGLREGLKHYPMSLEVGGKNLLKAWRRFAGDWVRCRQLPGPPWTDGATRDRTLGGGRDSGRGRPPGRDAQRRPVAEGRFTNWHRRERQGSDPFDRGWQPAPGCAGALRRLRSLHKRRAGKAAGVASGKIGQYLS